LPVPLGELLADMFRKNCVMSFLDPYGRNESCWCGSEQKYKDCHGSGPRFAPGALIERESENGEVWISPDTAIPRDVMDDFMSQMTGAPIYMPTDEMVPPPMQVAQISAHLAEIDALEPTLTLDAVGRQRFEALEGLGLADPKTLAARLADLSADDYEALVHAAFSTAKAVLDRLLEQAKGVERPTALWGTEGSLPQVVSQTLFWADHYLTPDELVQALIRNPGREQAPKLADALESALELRGLIEQGVVALVPAEAISVLIADEVAKTTESDLENQQLTAWLLDQMEIEGPTDREVLFVRPRDSTDNRGAFYLYGHVLDKPDEDGLVQSVSLQPYDPAFDYSPWIAQSRRKTAAGYLQDTNRNVAIAGALGAELLAPSPFEARLLQRKGRRNAAANILVRTAMPMPYEASASTLARVATEDEAVAELRATVRRTFSHARDTEDMESRAIELAEDLQREAERLEQRIRNEKVWKLAVPGGISVGSLLIGGALSGPLGGLAAGALAGLAGLSPYVADSRDRRAHPAYALLVARRQ
jgi:hypothetical protein